MDHDNNRGSARKLAEWNPWKGVEDVPAVPGRFETAAHRNSGSRFCAAESVFDGMKAAKMLQTNHS